MFYFMCFLVLAFSSFFYTEFFCFHVIFSVLLCFILCVFWSLLFLLFSHVFVFLKMLPFINTIYFFFLIFFCSYLICFLFFNILIRYFICPWCIFVFASFMC